MPTTLVLTAPPPPGWPQEDGTVKSEQVGVCRVNCIDCLDRTNVVQCVLARKALESALHSAKLLAPTASLGTAFPQVGCCGARACDAAAAAATPAAAQWPWARHSFSALTHVGW
jgi:hypothetical protein